MTSVNCVSHTKKFARQLDEAGTSSKIETRSFDPSPSRVSFATTCVAALTPRSNRTSNLQRAAKRNTGNFVQNAPSAHETDEPNSNQIHWPVNGNGSKFKRGKSAPTCELKANSFRSIAKFQSGSISKETCLSMTSTVDLLRTQLNGKFGQLLAR